MKNSYEKEVFKPLTEDIFVSNFGRIKRANKQLKMRKGTNGYMVININGKGEYVHRLVQSLFVDNPCPEEKIYVNHKDFDKTNNYYKNLEWVTPKENSIHQKTKGKFHSDEFKLIGQYSEEGLLEKIFLTVEDQQKTNNVSTSAINQQLLGKTNSQSKSKKMWRFLDPKNIIHKIEPYSQDKKLRDGLEVSSYDLNGLKLKTFNSIYEQQRYYSISTASIKGQILNRKGQRLQDSKLFAFGNQEKIEVHLSEFVSRRYKKVKIYKNDEEYIFNNKKEAQKFLNVQVQSISKCCTGEIKTVKGYFAEYIDI